jgi:alpha-D-xyloside xylohydrolase
VLSPVTQRAVYLPEGSWIDYWSGHCYPGRQTITVDAPLDRIPLFVREGAILPKIPDDVMTLVPSLDDRRVYEIYPGKAPQTLTDFEGRRLAYQSNALTITGPDALITLHFKFAAPSAITLNGRKLNSFDFSHHDRSTVTWK